MLIFRYGSHFICLFSKLKDFTVKVLRNMDNILNQQSKITSLIEFLISFGNLRNPDDLPSYGPQRFLTMGKLNFSSVRSVINLYPLDRLFYTEGRAPPWGFVLRKLLLSSVRQEKYSVCFIETQISSLIH